MQTILARGEHLELDAILAAKFGPVAGRAMLEETLALNPGLAAAGVHVPAGTVIKVPDPPQPDERRNRERAVSLFG